jgi:hypothetical protein
MERLNRAGLVSLYSKYCPEEAYVGGFIMRKVAKTAVVVAVAMLTAGMLGGNARADDITISLPMTISVSPGELDVTVDGTLTNNTGSPLDVLGSETVPGADPLSITDFSPFTLNPGTNGPMELFSFNVLPTAAAGTQVGTYAILDSLGNTYSVDFAVNIVEPGTGFLLASGLASLGLLLRKVRS